MVEEARPLQTGTPFFLVTLYKQRTSAGLFLAVRYAWKHRRVWSCPPDLAARASLGSEWISWWVPGQYARACRGRAGPQQDTDVLLYAKTPVVTVIPGPLSACCPSDRCKARRLQPVRRWAFIPLLLGCLLSVKDAGEGRGKALSSQIFTLRLQ